MEHPSRIEKNGTTEEFSAFKPPRWQVAEHLAWLKVMEKNWDKRGDYDSVARTRKEIEIFEAVQTILESDKEALKNVPHANLAMARLVGLLRRYSLKERELILAALKSQPAKMLELLCSRKFLMTSPPEKVKILSQLAGNPEINEALEKPAPLDEPERKMPEPPTDEEESEESEETQDKAAAPKGPVEAGPPKVDKNKIYKEAEKFYEAQKYTEAIATFKKILIIDPKHIPALLGIGEAYYSLKDYPNALKWFGKVLEVAPENSEAKVKQGKIQLEIEKKKKPATEKPPEKPPENPKTPECHDS